MGAVVSGPLLYKQHRTQVWSLQYDDVKKWKKLLYLSTFYIFFAMF